MTTTPSTEYTPDPLYPLYADIRDLLLQVVQPDTIPGESLLIPDPYKLECLVKQLSVNIERGATLSDKDMADFAATLLDCEERTKQAFVLHRDFSRKAHAAVEAIKAALESLPADELDRAKRELNIMLLNTDQNVRYIYSERLKARINKAFGFVDWAILGKIDRVLA